MIRPYVVTGDDGESQIVVAASFQQAVSAWQVWKASQDPDDDTEACDWQPDELSRVQCETLLFPKPIVDPLGTPDHAWMATGKGVWWDVVDAGGAS